MPLAKTFAKRAKVGIQGLIEGRAQPLVGAPQIHIPPRTPNKQQGENVPRQSEQWVGFTLCLQAEETVQPSMGSSLLLSLWNPLFFPPFLILSLLEFQG